MVKASGSTAAVKEPTSQELELHEEVKAAKGLDFLPESWEQVAEAFDGEIVFIEGSPWEVTPKAALVGVPFIIADVKIHKSDKYGQDFASICAMTKDNKRVVFNDGSTGVFEQIKATVSKTGRRAGIMVENGLRASTYKVSITDPFDKDAGPKEIESTTYYFA